MEKTSSLQRADASIFPALIAGAATLAFGLLVVISDRFWLAWMEQLFPNASPNLWGLVSRGHMLIFGIVVITVWGGPRRFGFQVGKTFQHWKMLITMLIVNCAVVGGYLVLSGGTPYSGNEWLLTETVWVPLIEELVWRGVVFTLLLAGLRSYYPERTSTILTIWIGGVVFGLLHANNLLYGVPPAFVAIQVLNAGVWGVVYSLARAKTDSIYPSMVLHSVMNLLVVLS
jgi:membrane protease YdiL (CAAX protease family)